MVGCQPDADHLQQHRMATVTRLFVLAWLLSLPGLTAARAHVWQSDLALWSDASAGSLKPRVWLNLGSALIQAQRYDDARAALERGIDLSPFRPDDEARVSMGYGHLLQAQLHQMEGGWNYAQIAAMNLKADAPTWPLAVQLCERLTC